MVLYKLCAQRAHNASTARKMPPCNPVGLHLLTTAQCHLAHPIFISLHLFTLLFVQFAPIPYENVTSYTFHIFVASGPQTPP